MHRREKCESVDTVHRRFQRPNQNPDRKSTRLNSSHSQISYAVFCLKKKKPRNIAHGVLYAAWDTFGAAHLLQRGSSNRSIMAPDSHPHPDPTTTPTTHTCHLTGRLT